MWRLSIRDLLWLILAVGLCLGAYQFRLQNHRLTEKIQQLERRCQTHKDQFEKIRDNYLGLQDEYQQLYDFFRVRFEAIPRNEQNLSLIFGYGPTDQSASVDALKRVLGAKTLKTDR